jgi:hypothetical protein
MVSPFSETFSRLIKYLPDVGASIPSLRIYSTDVRRPNTEEWSTFDTMGEQSPRTYAPPVTGNCLTYLQNMDEEFGCLRVIKGSHLDYTFIDREDEHKPHPRELLLKLNAGDTVFTHHELLHSGSLNISKETRNFLSVYVSRIGLPHRDTFDLPAIHEIKANARERNDRRMLRFFGEDEQVTAREEESWKRMIEEDRAGVLEEES